MPRKCSICRHPQRHEIEADLQVGLTYRDAARRYNLSKDVIYRHRASHVSLDTTPALSTVTKITELLHRAETASMLNTTLLMVREARHCMEELMTQLKYGIER
jgi:predicted transcriptional regulator